MNEIEFEEKIELLRKGKNIADQHCSRDVTTCYIIINRHIGDAARTLQLLKAVKDYYGENANRFHFADGHGTMNPMQKTKCIKKLIVLTTKSISGVARLYAHNFDGIIILNKDDLDSLEFYACSPVALHHNIICDENAYRMVFERWDFDEGNWIRSTLLGVGDLRWYLCLPNKLEISGMKISEEVKDRADNIIRSIFNGSRKIVILCPYAKSSAMLHEGIWVKYADWLQKIGFSVYTNVFGNEKVILGTQPLSVDIDIMVCLADMGYKIIGVQSGLMDVVLRSASRTVTILSVIKTARDNQFAKSRGAINEVNIVNNVTYLRIEHFEEDYVLKLLMDNFY